MLIRAGWAVAAATAAAIAAAGAMAGETSPAPAQARGEALFKARCQECHDPATDRAPTRQELAARTPEQIVAALTTGPMAPIAEDLTPDDKRAVAAYLTAH